MAKRKNKIPKSKLNKPKQNTQRLDLLIGLLIALASFLIYTNTFGHGYALDDASVIEENYLTKQGVKSIPTFYTTHYRYGYWAGVGTLYRPVTLSFFAIQYSLSPDSPGFYHFISVLLYALLGFVLYLTLLKVFGKQNRLAACIAALVFAVHPVHVEVVANIKSADEILALLFCLLALNWLWDYLDKKSMPKLILAIFAYTIAMFSKENAITFLAIFPLAIWFFRNETIRKNVSTSALFLLPASFFMLIRQTVLGGDLKGLDQVSYLDNLLAGASTTAEYYASAFLLIGRYFKNLILPHPLVHDLGFNQIPLTSFGDWQVIISVVIFLGLLIFGILGLKNKNGIAFGILFFMATFSVFFNLIIMIGSSFGDRFLFMPSLGFAISIGFLIQKFIPSVTSKVDNLGMFFKQNSKAFFLVLPIALLFAGKTLLRNPAWENSRTLYETDIELAPNSAKLSFHHGLEVGKAAAKLTDVGAKTKMLDEAISHLSKSIKLSPTYADAYAQRGLAYYRKGQGFYQQALADYYKALEIDPNKSKALSNAAKIYFEGKNYQKAIENYQKAIKIDPKFVDAHRNLGAVFGMTGRFDEAIKSFQNGLKYAPKDPTLRQYLQQAQQDKARAGK